jgi:hypothetical protein
VNSQHGSFQHGKQGRPGAETLHIDCGSCAARGLACDDCVVSVLLGQPVTGVDLDASDQAALAALADSGLVPPLRLIPGARPARAVQSPLVWPESG